MAATPHGDLLVQCFTGGPFAQNGYLVTCTRTRAAILVDPGAAVEEMLRVADEREALIGGIVLTHAHVDHVDGVSRARAATGAPIHLHPADDPLYHSAPTQAQWFGLTLEPLPPVDARLAHGDTIPVGSCTLEVRHAPGHAPGHVILVGEGLALVGDCVFAGSIGRTDLPGGDLMELMRSIRGQILTLPDETVLYPGHGPETTVGHERATNPFLTPQYGRGGFA